MRNNSARNKDINKVTLAFSEKSVSIASRIFWMKLGANNLRMVLVVQQAENVSH